MALCLPFARPLVKHWKVKEKNVQEYRGYVHVKIVCNNRQFTLHWICRRCYIHLWPFRSEQGYGYTYMLKLVFLKHHHPETTVILDANVTRTNRQFSQILPRNNQQGRARHQAHVLYSTRPRDRVSAVKLKGCTVHETTLLWRTILWQNGWLKTWWLLLNGGSYASGAPLCC